MMLKVVEGVVTETDYCHFSQQRPFKAENREMTGVGDASLEHP